MGRVERMWGPCAQYISLKPDKLIVIISGRGRFDLKPAEQLLCLKSLSEMYWALCLSGGWGWLVMPLVEPQRDRPPPRTSTRPPPFPTSAHCPYRTKAPITVFDR